MRALARLASTRFFLRCLIVILWWRSGTRKSPLIAKTITTGGASPITCLLSASEMIRTGQCDVVAVLAADVIKGIPTAEMLQIMGEHRGRAGRLGVTASTQNACSYNSFRRLDQPPESAGLAAAGDSDSVRPTDAVLHGQERLHARANGDGRRRHVAAGQAGKLSGRVALTSQPIRQPASERGLCSVILP